MNTVSLILTVFAFVLFALAAFGAAFSRVNLIGLGLAFWVLAHLLGRVAMVALALFAIFAMSGCATNGVTGEICYGAPNGVRACVSSDGETINLTGGFGTTGKSKTITTTLTREK